jgi:hypothetical protein
MPAALKPLLVLAAVVGGWLTLQLYVLPKLGLST